MHLEGVLLLSRIIDFHQHFLTNREDYLKELIKSMDENNIEKCVMHACPTTIWSWVGDNQQVLNCVEEYPDRIVGSVYVDPRDACAQETIEEYYSKGFGCVKMFPNVGFYPDDPALHPVFELISDLKLPVLFHSGTVSISDSKRNLGLNSKYGQPIYLEGLSRVFPKTPFILAHMGHPWFIEAWFLAKGFPNIYVDTSGGAWRGMELAKLFLPSKSIDFEKMVWGSDCSVDFQIKTWRDLLKSLGVEEKMDKIFYETSKKILS